MFCLLLAAALVACCAPRDARAAEPEETTTSIVEETTAQEATEQETTEQETTEPETTEQETTEPETTEPETTEPETTEPETTEPEAAPEAAPQAIDYTKADARVYPVIEMQGSHSPLYFNEGKADQVIAFEGGAEMMKRALYPILGDLITAGAMLDWNGVSDALVRWFWAWWGEIRINPDGTDVNPGLTRINDNGVMYGNMCHFYFDWRRDAQTLAGELDQYIDQIRAKTHAPRVNVIATSGSGPALLAYLHYYGTEKLSSAMFNQTLHNGSGIVGELAQRKLHLTPRMMSGDVLKMGEEFPDQLGGLTAILDALYQMGVLDVVSKFLALGSKLGVDRVYDDAVAPLMFTLPYLWDFCPVEYYESAKALMFRGNPVYAPVIARADKFKYEVQARADEVVKEAAKRIKVAIRVGYNIPTVLGNTNEQSDRLIETSLASFGSVGSEVGLRLPWWYRQKVSSARNYLSPDRMIDASACGLPDATWFSKNQYHQMETNYSGWYQWWLGAEEATVFGNPDYPQYSEMLKTGEYVPLPPAAPITLKEKLNDLWLYFLAFWRKVLNLPMQWIE
jgi:hypothetical protein